MPTATILCPHCAAGLKVKAPLAAGSRFRCPKCQTAFAVRPGDALAPVAAPGGADETPRSAGSRLPLLAVAGLGLCLLLGAAIGLAVFLSLKGASPAAVEARPDDRTPKDAPPLDVRPVAAPDQAAEPSQQLPAPAPEMQKMVAAAVQRGVDFLKKTQQEDGSWAGDHPVGRTALPALTLLECGVPPDDPHVQKAAAFVRTLLPPLGDTYDLALTVLFLDRLGNPQDEPLIRRAALRLLAGESPGGGWTYACPVPSEADEVKLAAVLEKAPSGASPQPAAPKPAAPKSGVKGVLDILTGGSDDEPSGSLDDDLKRFRSMVDGLSDPQKRMPALQPSPRADQMPLLDPLSDNSNTQFATLGLWAAGRHGVPVERALDFTAKRFLVTQTTTGGWGYLYVPHSPVGETPAMTGAGLLGLAVGHGLTEGKATEAAPAGEDPLVEKGMKALSQYIGKPAEDEAAVQGETPPPDYYFLWSVERVGMLYGRRTIGDKDWYAWGARGLAALQGGDGGWQKGSYLGAMPSTDTSFALLFLNRANLAKDLSSKVQFLTKVR